MKSGAAMIRKRSGGDSRWPAALIRAALMVLGSAGVFPGPKAAFAAEPAVAVEALAPAYYRDGDATLRAFAGIQQAVRHSVAKLDVDGSTVALATVLTADGLALTKASQLTDGHLTAWIAGGREVAVRRLAVDDDADLALVKIDASGLRPVRWADDNAFVGEWAITPGIEGVPQAVGIVSVPARRIPPRRAYIGIQLDSRASAATVAETVPGLGADRAGLQPGDVILSLNGTNVASADALVAGLKEFRSGQSVQLRLRRQDREFDVTIELELPKPTSAWRGSDRAERMNRMGGELSQRAADFARALQHDTVLEPWLCGGPLVNLKGEAIGLNIARAARVATYALPPDVVRQIAATLERVGPGPDREGPGVR